MKSQKEVNRLIGSKLEKVRESLGMTLEQVARYLEYPSYQTVSKLEKGTRKIQAFELARLSKLYNKTVNYFLDLEQAIENEPVIIWRKKPEGTKAVSVKNEFITFNENYKLLQKINEVDKPKFSPREIDRVSFEKDPYSNAEELAKEYARFLDLGAKPACLMAQNIARYLGVNVIFLDLGKGGSAASLYNPENSETAILVNSYEYEGRRNFSMAHELFHLITWNIFDPDEIYDDETNGKSKVEKYADVFASSFLMPAEGIRSEYKKYLVNNKISIVDCIQIANDYRVSLEALLWRLVWLNCIDKKQVQAAKDKNQIAEYSQIFRNDTKVMFSEDYINLAIKAFKRGNISKGKFAEMLRMSIAEVKSFLTKYGYDENEDYSQEFTAA